MRHDGRWPPARGAPTFPENRVDVWKVRLDDSAAQFSPDPQDMTGDSANEVLSADEKARAARFRFDKDRDRFSRCRAALRQLLARYLGVAAGKIHFDYESAGKPYVGAGQNPRGLQFNVSHSGTLALIAVSDRPLGVDIEQMRDDVDTTALAERFFSARERGGLRALPEPLHVAGFYACWTRKESFLKATGSGLSFPLADFSVTTHPDVAPSIEEIKGVSDAAKRWVLSDLSGVEGYRTALALQADAVWQGSLETYSWN